jgi:hypothetical protein
MAVHLGIVLSFIILFVRYFFNVSRRKTRKLVNQFPGPSPILPFIGNSLVLSCKPEGIG